MKPKSYRKQKICANCRSYYSAFGACVNGEPPPVEYNLLDDEVRGIFNKWVRENYVSRDGICDNHN